MGKKMNLSAYKRNTPAQATSDKADSAKKATLAKSKSPKRQESGSVSTEHPLPESTEKGHLSQGESKKTLSASTGQSRSEGIRLNRYIAHCGVCSRREADQLIADGKIKVNKKLVTEMGFKVMPGDNVFMGKKLLKKEDFAYVLLNKPKNFITTTKDTHDRKTVMDLVDKAADARLYPVGRLDRNTTGLLLLTNDGELTDRLSHPSNNIKKIYQVEINKSLKKEHFEEIVAGFTLEDGPIAIDEIAILTTDNMSIGIEIHSGRNRIVRRIFEHFDYEVTKLDRVLYAGLTKANLPRGKWRHLNDREIGLLKKKGKKR
jgi:23S rRNA pseudouridine2605 synthase